MRSLAKGAVPRLSGVQAKCTGALVQTAKKHGLAQDKNTLSGFNFKLHRALNFIKNGM